ncbi:hypothetical protein BSNK01_11760 [Bacillaceae bacterium]
MRTLKKLDLTSPQHENNPKLQPKGLVVHTTANRAKGANAVSHDRYYDTNSDRVSVHWTVDSEQAVLSVPEDRVAWHAGNRDYNLKYIGMEICENNVKIVNGRPELDEATYQNAVQLAADILHRHGWGIDRMIRHCDVPGREWKNCPNRELIDWGLFKANVKRELERLKNPSNEIPIYVNGKKVGCGQLIDNQTFVPIRMVGEALGATVKWDPQTRSVHIEKR